MKDSEIKNFNNEDKKSSGWEAFLEAHIRSLPSQESLEVNEESDDGGSIPPSQPRSPHLGRVPTRGKKTSPLEGDPAPAHPNEKPQIPFPNPLPPDDNDDDDEEDEDKEEGLHSGIHR